MIGLAKFFLGIALLLVAYLLACGINALIEAALGRYRARQQRQTYWSDGAQGEPATRGGQTRRHETKTLCITPFPASCSGLRPGRDESRSLRSGSAAGPVHVPPSSAEKEGM